MKPSYYLKVFPCEDSLDHRLLFSLKNASIIRVKKSLWDALENGNLSPDATDQLRRLGMAVDDQAIEKLEMLRFFDRLNSKNKELKVTAVINLDCNFACTYCYEGENKGKYYMTRQTADRLMDYIRTRFTEPKKHLHIDFYGGEPLLSMDLIRHIAGAARDFASNKGAEFKFNLITNGSLLKRSVAEELAELGLDKVRITVDGPAENHDRFRPFKSGVGSFDSVMKNIQETCDLVNIGIGGNFEKDNYRKFVSLLDYLVETGLTPDKIAGIKFDPVMKPPENDPALPEYHGGCASLNEPWIQEAVAYLREEILNRGYATQKVRPVTCMVDVQDNIMVHFDGTIYKCPAFIGKPEFAAGDLETGLKDYNSAYNTYYWQNEGCAHCVYLPLCFGGCRYMVYVRNGYINEVDCRKEYLDSELETLVKQDARNMKRKK